METSSWLKEFMVTKRRYHAAYEVDKIKRDQIATRNYFWLSLELDQGSLPTPLPECITFMSSRSITRQAGAT